MKGLVETLKLGDRMEEGAHRIDYNNAGEDDSAGYAAFEEAMITARNRTMAAHAGPILDRGNAFIAVGALHLPGEKGLIELFRKDGYTVTAVN